MAKRQDASLERAPHALSPALYGPRAGVARETALDGEAATAVVVVHGMGQQLEFQTLDEVERGLRRVDGHTGTTGGGVVEIDGTLLSRIELELHCTGGDDHDRTVPIHVFESYWASLTEGRVTLRDVISFLWRAGTGGLRNAASDFRRWMFGGWQTLPIEHGTAFWLLSALTVLSSLIALNSLIGLLGVGWVTARQRAAWLTPALLTDLSQGMLLLLAIAILCVAGAAWLRRMFFFWLLLTAVAVAGPALYGVVGFHARPDLHPRAAALIGAWWIPVVILLSVFIVVALAVRHKRRLWAVGWRAVTVVAVVLTAAVGSAVGLYGGPAAASVGWYFVVLWALLLAASAKVRKLLVQYVGDVAVYVSPHHLDRFQDLRDEIKGCVGKVVRAVLAAKDGSGGHRYQRIFIVGHSLGSVAAYDVMNRVLLGDRLAGEPLRVAERLKLLLTFGSPLDKTAFIFRRQAEEDAVTREVLAAAVQPMIHDPVLRARIPWVNVYSPKDIVSGPLSFYDDPNWPDAPPRVENVEDPDADVPVVAHVSYWKNDLVFRRLHEAICSVP